MPRPRPIPDELWTRLAALDDRTDTRLIRRSVGGEGGRLTTGRNYERYWSVEITGRIEPVKTVFCEHPALVQALEGAVRLAEQAWPAVSRLT